MAYQLTYTIDIVNLGPGMGPMSRQPAGASRGISQQGSIATATFTAADITTLLNGLVADAQPQLLALQPVISLFSSGGL